MSNRRISIHDYPEHLNPFNELYNDGVENGQRTKYYTWSTAGRHKIKHAILDKPWSSMSPSKLGRKLSFIKSITIDKFSPSKSKQKVLAVEPPHTPPRQEAPFVIISPKQKEKMRRLAEERLEQESSSSPTDEHGGLVMNGSPNISRSPERPARRKLSLQENGSIFDDSSSGLLDNLSCEVSSSSTGARPKPRKKRVAPPPPAVQQNTISPDMESNASSMEEGDRSISPDDSITQILEQDVIVHSDHEHNDDKEKVATSHKTDS